MHFTKMIANTLSTAALCAAFVSGASLQAATVSFSSPIPLTDAAGHNGNPSSTTFTLPQFDPSLGSLQSVHIEFALQYQGEVDIFNFSGSPQNFTNATSTVPIDISTPSPSVAPFPVSYGVSSGSLVTSPPLNQFLGPVLNMTIPFDPGAPDFLIYEGLGTNSYSLLYGVGTFGGSSTAPGGTVFFGGDAISSGTASVLYTYNAVPEPSTLALLALGVLGLVTVAGRRRRRMRRRLGLDRN